MGYIPRQHTLKSKATTSKAKPKDIVKANRGKAATPKPQPIETTLSKAKPKVPKKKDNINENLKFEIEGDNKVKLWGISSFMTKTPYTKGTNSRPATEEEIKAGNSYIPKRYFAYVIHDGKPVLLIENKDQRKNLKGQIETSPAYFKPATIRWHLGESVFTHYDRNTNEPFLCITSKNPNVKPSSVKPDTMFHVKDNGWIICEKFDLNKSPVVWSNKERYPAAW